MALKFGSSKSEFGLRSGSANKGGLPFKEMGGTPAKGLWEAFQKGLSGRTREIGEKSGLGIESVKTKEDVQKEEADKQTQKVVDKTDKDITTTKKKELGWEKLQHQKDVLDFEKQKHTDKTSTTKPSMTAEEIKKGKSKAKARDIFTAMGSGKAEFGHQQAFEDKMTGLDVATAEKTENQEELPPAEQFVDDGSYTAVSDAKSSTGSEMFGEIGEKDITSHYAGKKKDYKPGDPEWEAKRQELIDRANSRTT